MSELIKQISQIDCLFFLWNVYYADSYDILFEHPKISAYRPNVPILAFCDSTKVAKQLMLHRGVHPIHVGDEINNLPIVKRGVSAIQYAKQFGMVQEGDNVVVVARELATDGLTTDFATMKIATVP